MKTMITAILLALVMSLSLCACGGTTDTTSAKDTSTKEGTSAVDENGTLSDPAVDQTDKTNEEEETKAVDLTKPDKVIESFKLTHMITSDDALGDILVNKAGYTDETMPTYGSVFGNMLTETKYNYDVENVTLTVTGDLDVASLATMLKFTMSLDESTFQGFDKLMFEGNYYFYKINSNTVGFDCSGTIAIVDQYGEGYDTWIAMIIICSEMKKGNIDWDEATEIVTAYNEAYAYYQ